MKVCGIVCEYNPFHNGHKYQIDYIKQNLGFDAVVGIMSGNYTQRGDVAVYDKSVRALAAVQSGMDLVLELPAVHSMQSAEIFAFNSIYILHSLGLIDSIAFGAEHSEIIEIQKTASLLYTEPKEFKMILKSELQSGKPFFLARKDAVYRILGNSYANIISEPNNILAIEYIKALYKLNSNIEPILIKRYESEHNDTVIHGEIASASAIRNILNTHGSNMIKAVPENCISLYKNSSLHRIEKLDTAIISNIIKSDINAIRNTPDVSEGLENKIKKSAFSSKNFSELCDNIKSKRYAHSRIRRIIMNIFLGITKEDAVTPPQYIKILNFNKKGQELLHNAKSTSKLPLAKNRNGINNIEKAVKIWDREIVFDKLYELSQI